MAAAIGIGGDGGVSVVLRERAEEGEEHRGSEKGRGGCVASRTGCRATRGRRQAGGGRGSIGARRPRALPTGAGKTTGGTPGGLGRIGGLPAQELGRLLAPGKCSLLCFIFCLFSIFFKFVLPLF